MKLSKKFAKKLIETGFNEINYSWYQSFYKYMVDSQYRTYKRLDKFLKEQLEGDTKDLKKIVKEQGWRRLPPEKAIISILKWAHTNIKYSYDKDNWKKVEYWATANEVLERKRDDCDGLSVIIYILGRLSGIPSYLLWNCIGDTNVGGHYWLVFINPKTGKIHSIDGTFYPDFTLISRRRVFKIGKKYISIWYIFNENFAWKSKTI